MYVPTTTDPRVRVILVNYHSERDIEERLSSEALTDAHVIVVDNASDPDRIRQLCAAHGATALLLDDNRGFAAGVNAAWDCLRGLPRTPLLLLNPDAKLTRPALDELLGELRRTGSTGVAPLLVEPSGRLQVGAAGGGVSFGSVVAYFLLLSHLLPKWKGIFLTRRQSRSGGLVAWLCMACLLLEPDALETFGPVPEDELVYAEDLAWGTSASSRGARFTLVPHVRLPHPHGSSGGSAAWAGALERTLRRRLGPAGGAASVRAVRTGLALRRLVGRSTGT